MYAAQLIRICRRVARHDWTLIASYSKLEMFVDTDTSGTNKKTRMRRQRFVSASPPSVLGLFRFDQTAFAGDGVGNRG